MKKFNLLLIAIFVCVFSLSTLSVESFAVSKKDTTQVGTSSKTTTAKKNTVIPQNVNINTADKDLLEQLPGIGPVTAGSIIKYRDSNGNFKNIGELTKVKGIGSKTLKKLEPYLLKL